MDIDKDQVLQLLRSRSASDQAQQAQTELPDQVDTDNPEHQNLLQRFGPTPPT